MTVGEYLRINTPAFLFAAGAAGAAIVASMVPGTTRIVVAVIGWWCLCGTVMLFIDFGRKREIFQRLVARYSHRRLQSVPPGLTGTFCGLCILWALQHRTRCVRVKKSM